MGEADEKDEGNTTSIVRYLIERLRNVEAENKELRTSEGNLRRYLERQLEDYEQTEKDAQEIRDLLFPAVEGDNGNSQ